MIVTVSYVDAEDKTVYIWTKELAFPLRALDGEQVTYADK